MQENMPRKLTLRHNFSNVAYGLWFVIFNTVAIILLQLSVQLNPSVSVAISFITKVFTGQFQFVTNFLLLGLVYISLILLTNRFWIGTALYMTFIGLFTSAEFLKLNVFENIVLPADFKWNLMNNIYNFMEAIAFDFTDFFLITLACSLSPLLLVLLLGILDTRKRFINLSAASHRTVARLLLSAVCITLVTTFVIQMATIDSWANRTADFFSDSPKLWDSQTDAKANGTAIGFARLINPKVMHKPHDYSQKSMLALAQHYANSAQSINATRTGTLTNSTVIFLLSESFSNPARVPGVKLNKDVIPRINAIKKNTTSGLMLSAGFGGGTANQEYMTLSGLSMANFSPALTSPMEQIVPQASWAPIVANSWLQQNTSGFHSHNSKVYSRNADYEKFGFNSFTAKDGPLVLDPQKKIDRGIYISDESLYTAVINSLKNEEPRVPRFIQMSTMQNHMPYKNWYNNNEVKASSTTQKPLTTSETQKIQTYAKGLEYTDKATQKFLDELDAINRPITLVFYGDHLPAAYETATKNPKNSVALHETDYFIWSNKASRINNAEAARKATNAAYSSPNFFQAQVAEHLNAKVSPFQAFLTELHAHVAAMEPPVANKIQEWKRLPLGSDLYLDGKGKAINPRNMDAKTRQLLADYKLIQYDITAGKHYLKSTSFMSVPGAQNTKPSQSDE
ncbi:sulfatase-like hydrolase/transferase [Alloscardovia venturai]|uniref:Sulfatase-like hydrolase/transferase n=1 Tax=Alloscardovia venturai TaxID=1769421 RepID=A0ABW2Y522_9BIFI